MRMKTIKNMKGLLLSLSKHGYIVLWHSDDKVVIYVDSVSSKRDLEQLYSSRLSFLKISLNNYCDIVLTVKFF